MTLVQPDLSDVGPIEGGTYKASILAANAGVSKSGGSKIVVDFGVDVDGKQRKRQVHLPYTGAGAFGFASLLRACHMDELADAYMSKDAVKPPFDTDSLVGQELMVVVEPDTYNGQVTDKINSYLRA